MKLLPSLAGVLLLLAFAAPQARGQEDAAAEPQPTPAAQEAEPDLAVDQAKLADRFTRLQAVMLKLAELSASTDPRRAAVLRRAVAESNEQELAVRFESVVKLLEDEQLSLALRNQQELRNDLQKLLDLLIKEDRANRVESEKRRIGRLVKEVGRIIKEQRGIKARTEGGDELDRVADAQERVTEKTQQLEKELQPEGEPTPAQGSEKQNSDSDQDGGEQADEKQEGEKESKGEGDPQEQKQEGQQGEPKAGEQQDGQKGQQGDQQDQQSEQHQQGQQQGQQGQQGDQNQPEKSPQEQQEDSVRKRIEAARKNMQQAREKLQQAQREGAKEDQQKAIEQLEQAKAELEKILRQLREEEMERVLAMLEARFRKMLEMQIEVHEGTLRLDQLAAEKRGRDDEIEAGRLSRKEAAIVREADVALNLLREEGSSLAFPEAVGQMRDDMEQITIRLAQVKTDEITQGLEEDVIAALEEMVEALKKAQKDLEKKKNQQPPQEGMPTDMPLVDAIAELKMIRALQMRVNTRTERYSQMIEGEQAQRPELLSALERLAERQQRIFRVTRDLHLGKNR